MFAESIQSNGAKSIRVRAAGSSKKERDLNIALLGISSWFLNW